MLAAGDYTEPVDVAVDGTAAAPIAFVAEPGATMHATLTIQGHAHLVVAGILFDSPDAQMWLRVDGSDLRIVGNAFDSHARNRDDGAFVGLALAGERLEVCGNAFGSWLGDMVSADGVDGLAIVNNDFALASAQHALVAIVGHHVLIRGNAFRNPWQRTLHISDRTASDGSEDIVVENNTFIDSDWQTGAPNPSNEEQFQGGNEVVRFLGVRGIFRNNLLVGNHEGNDWACHGILNFSTFISGAGIDARRYAQFRVYANTFDANQTTSIIFYVGEPGIDLADNQFKNNVITNPEQYAISMCSAQIPWPTYRFAGNLVPGATVHLDDSAPSGIPILAAQVEQPSVFANNLDAQPTYVDPTFAARVAADFTSYGVDHLADAFAAYRLADASAGRRTAVALTTVRSSIASALVVPVEDALWFSDGMGLVPGDQIRIGATVATIVARDVEGRALTVDTPVTAAIGDPIVLAADTGDLGIR